MSRSSYSREAAFNREKERLIARIERYRENVEYFTSKRIDSVAAQMNKTMLLADEQAYRQLTGKFYPAKK